MAQNVWMMRSGFLASLAKPSSSEHTLLHIPLLCASRRIRLDQESQFIHYWIPTTLQLTHQEAAALCTDLLEKFTLHLLTIQDEEKLSEVITRYKCMKTEFDMAVRVERECPQNANFLRPLLFKSCMDHAAFLHEEMQ